MTGRNIRTLAFFTVLAAMLACAPVFQPSVIPPTLDPFAINTAIAQTAAAAATQTAVFSPSTATLTPRSANQNTNRNPLLHTHLHLRVFLPHRGPFANAGTQCIRP